MGQDPRRIESEHRDYIPTRYPNGVPYGMPHEFYDADDAEERLRWAREIVETCRQILPNT